MLWFAPLLCVAPGAPKHHHLFWKGEFIGLGNDSLFWRPGARWWMFVFWQVIAWKLGYKRIIWALYTENMITVLTLHWCLCPPESPSLHGRWHLKDDDQKDASSLFVSGRSPSDWGDPSANISEAQKCWRMGRGHCTHCTHVHTPCLPGQCDCPLWPWLMGLISKLFSESGPECQSWNPFPLSKGGQAANISPPGKWSVSLEPLDEDHDFKNFCLKL